MNERSRNLWSSGCVVSDVSTAPSIFRHFLFLLCLAPELSIPMEHPRQRGRPGLKPGTQVRVGTGPIEANQGQVQPQDGKVELWGKE